MQRESFVFYKSFYESIKELDPKDQVQIYNAIFQYQFENREVELTGIAKSIFTLIIPQLEANNKKYQNGCKGGAPKGNQNARKKQPETTKKQPKNNQKQPNDNVNVNDNENDNDNVVVLYNYLETNFGRTLSPIEYEIVNQWENNDLTKYAIKQAVLNGKYSIKYIDRILQNFKINNIQTVQQAQERENEFKNKKIKKEEEPKKYSDEWWEKLGEDIND